MAFPPGYNRYNSSSKFGSKPTPPPPPPPKPHKLSWVATHGKFVVLALVFIEGGWTLYSYFQDKKNESIEINDLHNRIRVIDSINAKKNGVPRLSSQKIEELVNIATEYNLNATQLFKIIDIGEQLKHESNEIKEYALSRLRINITSQKDAIISKNILAELELVPLLEVLSGNAGSLEKSANDEKARNSMIVKISKLESMKDKLAAAEDSTEMDEKIDDMVHRALAVYVSKKFNALQDFFLAQVLYGETDDKKDTSGDTGGEE